MYQIPLFLVIFSMMGNLLSAEFERSNEIAFSEIYATKAWGTNDKGEGYSGEGSRMDKTVEYRQFLQPEAAHALLETIYAMQKV